MTVSTNRQEPIAAMAILGIMGKTIYPQPFAARVEGRLKRKLGDHFGLANFGVNLTHLLPDSSSALAHSHSRQDEFIYILDGTPTLILGEDEFILKPGDCCGFKSGTTVPHQLINRSSVIAIYLEIGDRTVGDEVEYPHDDLKATQLADGTWLLTHQDGSAY